MINRLFETIKFSSIMILATMIDMNAFGQNQAVSVELLTLEEVVSIAKVNSRASLQAVTLKENRYWQWKVFQSNYKPQLVLDGQLPNFARTNVPVTQPDGTVVFQPVTNDNSQLNLSLTQNIAFSGAQISLKSNLLRFTDFERRQTRYNGNPIIIGFSQPLFTFNPLSWDKKTEPLRFEESQKKYTEDMEVVGYTSSSLFFELLIAQINHEIAEKNKANNDTLYKIAEKKYGLGMLPKDELLQLKLALLNAGKSLAQAELSMESAMFQLKTYIGYNSISRIQLKLPEDLPKFEVDLQTAIEEATNNKQQIIAFQRSLLEANREIARAKGENGLNASIFGTFGFTNRANNIGGIYSNPKDQQTITIGFRIPVLDWGRSASRIKTAEVNKKLVKYNVEQEKIEFEQQITTQVLQFKMIRGLMKDNADADQTAQQRYEIAKNRYILGDISITDLNIALQEKDQSKRDYIFALKNFWDACFNLRILTLYDFERKKKIEF